MHTLQMFLGMGRRIFSKSRKAEAGRSRPMGKKAYSPNVFRSGLGMPCNHYFQAGTA